MQTERQHFILAGRTQNLQAREIFYSCALKPPSSTSHSDYTERFLCQQLYTRHKGSCKWVFELFLFLPIENALNSTYESAIGFHQHQYSPWFYWKKTRRCIIREWNSKILWQKLMEWKNLSTAWKFFLPPQIFDFVSSQSLQQIDFGENIKAKNAFFARYPIEITTHSKGGLRVGGDRKEVEQILIEFLGFILLDLRTPIFISPNLC